MRDPYDVLGVPKQASADDIKKAYRRLAKKLHPDANNKDPRAAQRFAELNGAYEVVGDEDKRRAFDRGEIDAEGKPRFHSGFEGAGAGAGRGFAGRDGFETFSWGPEGFRRSAGRPGGFKIEDVLGDMFGGGFAAGQDPRAGGGHRFESDEPGRGRDVTAALTIGLEEAAKGVSKRLRLASGKDVDVKIPAGLTDGQQIRLKGQGLPGPAGIAGDVLITVSIAPHPLFRLDGTDLRLELPITLYEAVLGGKVRVPTLQGAVELAIPPGTSSGRTFRLKGKGMPAKHLPGDLFATARIVLPDQPDPELDELMRRWRDKKPYTVRES
jgi:DnaJ-class molecular chaperone